MTPVALAMALLRICAWRSSLADLTGNGALALEELLYGEANVARLIKDLGKRTGWSASDLLHCLGECRP